MLTELKNKAISTAAKQAANNTTLAKRGQSNGNTLIKLALMGVAGFVAYRAYTKLNGVIADAVKPVAQWWVNATTDENVQTNNAAVFLKSKYINMGKLSPAFIDAVTKANPQNAQIIKNITDPLGRLKQQYYHLIDSNQPATLQNTGG